MHSFNTSLATVPSAMAFGEESDFDSLLEDIDAERSLLVTQEERIIELTGATITTATSKVSGT
jgi:hypothetical protein